jgi:hypothetical protein
MSGALDPALPKLLVAGTPIPSLVGTFNQLARQQPNANACVAMAPKVDGMRPGLRAQMPTANPERAKSRPAAQPPHGRSR